ncbi:MAG: DUF2254 domain-containing protein [Gammaproteobacteria bacterium]|nr:DUF2254 domain-containing protein [Gammaproteobacteria bacterium]
MFSNWRPILLLLRRALWVRSGLICLLAVAAAILAPYTEPYVPDELPTRIGADSVETLLRILASSMLAVTTFSLTVMVAAYSAAERHVTPRAAGLLREDTTTHNVLATFIGAFLFSLSGIVLLSTQAFGSQARVPMFLMTLAVVLLIVVTLLRWIQHLSQFGRLAHTTDRIEKEVTRALLDRARSPFMGANPLRDGDIPADAEPVFLDSMGYAQHLDVEALNECAREHESRIYGHCLPGAFIDFTRPVVRVAGGTPAAVEEAVRSAYSVAVDRTYEQDPRFGLSVLTEVASRALSPSVNDSGTAIDIIGRLLRMLTIWTQTCNEAEAEIEYSHIWIPGLVAGDLMDDAFGPIARDAADKFEVQVRLQKALAALDRLGHEPLRTEAQRLSRQALTYTDSALALEVEKRRIRHSACGGPGQEPASNAAAAAVAGAPDSMPG